eukprot:CAMPEP_0113886398 /NCGR_PEP_ID=MMETSP0780_2-20120614/11528_1 /TAXON_ID=652834 /ORGANISM="Palpitomonas bilix" /LENGTH=999 /DNA_ID=CAMNT_0000874599 /DNA_START=5 /DNA_END=3004 /DNA_ORIENTATION=- /assembly_acc=CAM_ASM_000599
MAERADAAQELEQLREELAEKDDAILNLRMELQSLKSLYADEVEVRASLERHVEELKKSSERVLSELSSVKKKKAQLEQKLAEKEGEEGGRTPSVKFSDATSDQAGSTAAARAPSSSSQSGGDGGGGSASEGSDGVSLPSAGGERPRLLTIPQVVSIRSMCRSWIAKYRLRKTMGRYGYRSSSVNFSLSDLFREVHRTEVKYEMSFRILKESVREFPAFSSGRVVVNEKTILLRDIFMSVPEIVEMHARNCTIFDDTNSTLPSLTPRMRARAIIESALRCIDSKFIDTYSAYLESFERRLCTLSDGMKEPTFRAVIADVERKKEVMGKSLPSLFILPFQHITKLVGIIEEMQRRVVEGLWCADDSEDEAGDGIDKEIKARARELLTRTRDIADKVTDSRADADQLLKMLVISNNFSDMAYSLLIPGRRFVRESLMEKISTKKSGAAQLRRFFLFNDVLIYAQSVSDKGKGGGRLAMKGMLELKDLEVEDVAEAMMEGRHAFRITVTGSSWSRVIVTNSKREKECWMSDLLSFIKIQRTRASWGYEKAQNVELYHEGYLLKLGGHGKLAGWKRRWFVLRRSTLSYFKSKDDKGEALGVITLAEHGVVVGNKDEVKHKHAFKLVNASHDDARTYHLAAESAWEMQRWVTAISKGGCTMVDVGEKGKVERGAVAQPVEAIEKKYSQLHTFLVGHQLPLVSAIVEVTPFDYADNVSRALTTIFHHDGDALRLLYKVIEKEVEVTESEETLFRSNSIASKVMTFYARLVGTTYLLKTLEKLLHRACTEPGEFEVDPARLSSSKQDPTANVAVLEQATASFLDAILSSIEYCPKEFRKICNFMSSCVAQRFPNSKVKCVGGFIFLRFFCPAIVAPEGSKLVSVAVQPDSRRKLVLIAKVLQNLANGVKFGAKEAYMTPFHRFLDENDGRTKAFLEELAKIPTEAEKAGPSVESTSIQPEQLQKAWSQLHLYFSQEQQQKKIEGWLEEKMIGGEAYDFVAAVKATS